MSERGRRGHSDGQTPQVVETLHLEVHPSVVFKLGADLITDDVQALTELVKNSYDADASRVHISVDTSVLTDPITGATISDPVDSTTRALSGRISVVDDGVGMDLETIRRGWLTVSISEKQAMKAAGLTTSKKRTPLGDKGLGRLGAQRLGDVITLSTRRRHSQPDAQPDGLRITIRWSDFASADRLSAVPLHVERIPAKDIKPGTTLEIRGLRDAEFWRQGETETLQRKLATMISPYEDVGGFQLFLRIDDVRINLREKAQAILEAAPVHYFLQFDGEEFTVNSRFAISFFKPTQGRNEMIAYEDLLDSDNGYAFSKWILNEKQPGSRTLGLSEGDDKHFLFGSSAVRLDELPDVELQNQFPVNPGPFTGEVSAVPLDRDATSVFDRASEYREFVKALVGIKVYRDGFGIRVDDDWLGLGSKWTSGTSFYSLRPGNVIGYVKLSAKHNPALEETTNREAFSDTPAYRNFYKLLSWWADYTERAQAHLRRRYNDYKKTMLAADAGVEPAATTEDLLEQAGSQADQLSNLVTAAERAQESLKEIRTAAAALEEAKAPESPGFNDPSFVAAVDQMIAQVKESTQRADHFLSNLYQLEDEQRRLKSSLDLLSNSIEIGQRQIGDAWESVALGLSAEALVHEVQQISDGLKGRSAQISRYLRDINFRDQRVWTFVEHVRSAVDALGKQTSRLTPSLRYVRERKVDVRMSDFLSRLKAYHSERWGAKGIQMEVLVKKDFSIRMNEGKLTQVFDNLILNSEYWLLQQLRTQKLAVGVIEVEVDDPFVSVRDNGPGVDPSVEDIAFDPFVTMKPAQQGRGLGLFVVRQLLDAEQDSIALSPERNDRGRRYEFRLNLAGSIPSASGRRQEDM